MGVIKGGEGAVVAYPLFQREGGGSIPTSPLQLEIEEIYPREAQRLNRLWHSVLPETHLGNIVGHKHVVCYGAIFNGRWYACAIWTDPIAGNRLKNGDTMIELRRLAISHEAPKFTALRMLKIMCLLIRKKWPELQKAISYQALNFHHGTIYKAAGWVATTQCEQVQWKSKARGRSRKDVQISSPKIRWEKDLR